MRSIANDSLALLLNTELIAINQVRTLHGHQPSNQSALTSRPGPVGRASRFDRRLHTGAELTRHGCALNLEPFVSRSWHPNPVRARRAAPTDSLRNRRLAWRSSARSSPTAPPSPRATTEKVFAIPPQRHLTMQTRRTSTSSASLGLRAQWWVVRPSHHGRLPATLNDVARRGREHSHSHSGRGYMLVPRQHLHPSGTFSLPPALRKGVVHRWTAPPVVRTAAVSGTSQRRTAPPRRSECREVCLCLPMLRCWSRSSQSRHRTGPCLKFTTARGLYLEQCNTDPPECRLKRSCAALALSQHHSLPHGRC